jgi:ABC-type transport system involved in cytochrome c biogenesis permease subunit
VAYAALFASFALAVWTLAYPAYSARRRKNGNGKEQSAEKFELYAHQAAIFGICALTLGLIMGAAWGKVAWGEYWTWDPKENWSLVCWLAYMIYLHLRLVNGWRERKAMWVLVIAFAAVIFTYLGINLLPTASGSLHAYQ